MRVGEAENITLFSKFVLVQVQDRQLMKRREVTNFQDHVKRVTNFLRSRNTLSGKGEIPLSVKLRYDDECLRFSLRARPASWDARKSNEVKSLFTEDGPLEVTTGSHEVKPAPGVEIKWCEWTEQCAALKITGKRCRGFAASLRGSRRSATQVHFMVLCRSLWFSAFLGIK